jgi:hypothetical protein
MDATSYCAYARMYNALLKAMCDKNGAIYVPLAEGFNPTASDFRDICHLTDDGIARKADLIGRHVAAHLPSE